ncbi:MAG: hypothetical protein ACFFDB_10455 [Promethearchaeota archaeon]
MRIRACSTMNQIKVIFFTTVLETLIKLSAEAGYTGLCASYKMW